MREFTTIFCHYREFTMNLLGVLWFTMDFREITRNSLALNSLPVSWIYVEFTWWLANEQWIQYLYHEFAMNSRLNYDFTFCSTNLLYFRENAINSLSFRYITLNSLLFREFTIFLANLLWIQCLVHKFTIFYAYHKFIIYFANSKWIHYLFCEFTIYFATQLWFYFLFDEYAIYFAKIKWLHYLSRYNTMNSLSVRRIHY